VKKFIPFGDGARSCVGRTLAQLNLTTALAQLYGHFTFRLADEVRALRLTSAACYRFSLIFLSRCSRGWQ